MLCAFFGLWIHLVTSFDTHLLSTFRVGKTLLLTPLYIASTSDRVRNVSWGLGGRWELNRLFYCPTLMTFNISCEAAAGASSEVVTRNSRNRTFCLVCAHIFCDRTKTYGRTRLDGVLPTADPDEDVICHGFDWQLAWGWCQQVSCEQALQFHTFFSNFVAQM